MSLCIVLLAASGTISGQTYTVIHNFGGQAGDPSNPYKPGENSSEPRQRGSRSEARMSALREFRSVPMIADVTREQWGWLRLELLDLAQEIYDRRDRRGAQSRGGR
jgi:hypothetical protein